MNNHNQGAGIQVQQGNVTILDVWRVLLLQKKIILTSLLVFSVLGLLFVLLRPATYAYSTTVQLGSIVVSKEGKAELVENPDTALNKITSAYVPFVMAQYYAKNPDDHRRYQIQASIPKKSDILIIQAKGTLEEESAYKDLIVTIVNKLIDDHSRIVNLRVKNFEVEIGKEESLVLNSKDNAKMLTANLAQQEKTADMLRTQIAEKKRQLGDSIKNRSRVNSSNATGAMSVLLMDSEIQRYQALIDQTEKTLLVDLNEQRNELEKKLSDSLREQKSHQNVVDQLKNELANISNTRAIVPVMRSSDPIGLGKLSLLMMVISLGMLFGIAAALVNNFLQNIRAS